MKQNNEIVWKIDGMSCVNCALGIESFLKKEGIDNPKVDFASKKLIFENKNINLKQLKIGIQNLGFSVIETPKATQKNNTRFLFMIIVSVIFTIPLLLSMFSQFGTLKNPLIQLLLCLPVGLIGLYHFGKKAFASLKMGVLNMDILIVLGAGAAFIYSCLGLFLNLGNEFVFFETTASIFTIILIGNYIEKRSIVKTTQAIESLVELQPQKAIKNIDNSWQEVDFEKIEKGDRLLIKNGDTIPVDGIIYEGNTVVNQASLTGESEGIEKKLNDTVLAGTIALEGPFYIIATKVGKDTSLQKVISLVEKAQAEKPKIQRLADKVSAYFIPIVILIAIFTFFLNYYFFNLSMQTSLLRTIAVLVVACPCALGLATPTAVIVGVGKLSKIGMLINSGELIEELAKVKNVIFDKTGTLTSGNFRIANANSVIDGYEFKQILKTLESKSSHSIAKSINDNLENVEELEFKEIEEIKGVGIFGKDSEGNTYAVGSYSLAKNQTKESNHSVYVLKNNSLIGWLDLEDEVKPEVSKLMQLLRAKGLKTYILSGDKHSKTEKLAKELGVENYYAEKLPSEKLEQIAEIQKNGITMMVGDGINDAPALTKANIGISLGNATDVAINAADGVLISNDLSKISQAIEISRATNTCIKQNLFWAFFYNILMIPLAIFGFLHPMFAALAMGLSDLIVIGNAIRLHYKKV